jgi:hypothetical protein
VRSSSLFRAVDFPYMDVKHLSQNRLFRKRIAYEVKSNSGAERAPRTLEMVLGLGF